MGLFGPRYAHGQSIDIDGLTLRLTVNARSRRISLRVDRLRGEAIAVAPNIRHLADAVAFARARRDWLAERLARPEPVAPLAADDHLVVFGRTWRLQPDGRRPRLVDDPDGADDVLRLVGCGAGVVDPQLVTRAVRQEAAAVYSRRTSWHCGRLGAPPPPVRLADARTRWGSCTSARPGGCASIRLSWRLAFAPLAVADYVVAHECAHLLEANHGPRFWSHVRALVGDERPHRVWLRQNGAALHAILPRTRN